MDRISSPIASVARWLGGWSRLALLVLALAGLGAGLIWEQRRHPPTPPGAEQVAVGLMSDIRQTSFWFPGAAADLRAFYRQQLPQRGWEYCGTQATPGCTNLTQLIDRPSDAMDVYRRADDRNRTGSTIEVWPVRTENGRTFVTIFETPGG
jgi:hypothetical protein